MRLGSHFHPAVENVGRQSSQCMPDHDRPAPPESLGSPCEVEMPKQGCSCAPVPPESLGSPCELPKHSVGRGSSKGEGC